MFQPHWEEDKMAPSSREGFLEKKVSLLDKRLTLLEKFVEARFGDGSTFQTNANLKCGTAGEPKVAKVSLQSHPSEDYQRDPDPIHSNEDFFHSPRARDGGGGEVPKIVNVFGSAKKSRPAPLSMKKNLVLKIDKLAPSTLASLVVATSKQRYNTRSKGSAKDKGDVDVVETESQGVGVLAKVEIENESYQDEMRSGGPCSPADQDDLDESNENDNNYEERPETEHVQASNYHLGEDGSEVGSSRKNRKRKLPDISAEPSDDDYEPPISDGSDDDGGESSGGLSKKRKSDASRARSNKSRKKKSQIYAPVGIPIAREDGSRKKCPECHKYQKIELFAAHVNSHFKERNFKCFSCDKTFFNKSMLQKHKMIHEPEKYATKCRQCGSVFPRNDKALAHERMCVRKALEREEHVDEEIISDIKKRSLNWNQLVAVANSQGLKQCPHCNKNCKANFYQSHVRTHTDKQEWVCSLCDKAYFHKTGLSRHFAATHQLSSCDICKKTFEDKNLERHVLECRRQQQNSKSTSKDVDASKRTDELELEEEEI